MSIPSEALQKLLQEIEQKATFSQQQMGIVKAQIAAKNRESRLLQLTSSEVSSLPKDTNVYEGDRLSSETEELKSDMSNLEKKLHYLETTYKNSRDHLEQLFSSGRV
ncbi:hypothetical protein BJ546DRAFT_1026873 [Cryomyces antarcticus]